MKTIAHHVIPCSLDGFDIDFNIIHLNQRDHNLVHRILSMPYWRIRKFRFSNALSFRKDKKYYERLLYILSIYFENIEKLPVLLIKKHKKAIAEMVMILNNKKYGYSVNSNMTVSYLLKCYCEVLLLISLSRENLI